MLRVDLVCGLSPARGRVVLRHPVYLSDLLFLVEIDGFSPGDLVDVYDHGAISRVAGSSSQGFAVKGGAKH